MLQLINTADGSHTLRHLGLQETYHSVHGAVQESAHVYIQHGLHYFMDRDQPRIIKILEVGFGTGLNALLTLVDKKARDVEKSYDTVEAFPLGEAIVKQLNYPACLPEKDAAPHFMALHRAAWGRPVRLGANFSIHKTEADFCSLPLRAGYYDVVYFDAFGPKVQPGIWAKPVLARVEAAMAKGGILVTYCASGQFKRDLMALGMEVEELPRPPGKRVMVRACRSCK